MKKLTYHAWILWAVALALTALFMFVLPFDHTPVFWIACGCTAAMFLVVAWAFFRSFRKGDSQESKLLGWPIFKAACVALAAQIAVAFVLMILANICPVLAAVVVEAVIFALTVAILTVRDASRETVTASETRLPDRAQAMKSLRAAAASMAVALNDPAAKDAMRQLADELKFADPVTSEATEEYEAMLKTLLDQAKQEKDPKACLSIIDQARLLLCQRADAAKMSK